PGAGYLLRARLRSARPVPRRGGLDVGAAGEPPAHAGLEEVVRVDDLGPTEGLEALGEGGGDRELERAEVVVELGELGGADDRRGDARAGGDPVERDLGGRAPELARDLDDGVDDLPVA